MAVLTKALTKAASNSLAEEYKSMSYDPLMLQTVMLARNSQRHLTAICRSSGVSRTTFANWEKKRTHRPQASTMRFILRAIGYELSIKKS